MNVVLRNATVEDVGAILDFWKRAEATPSITDTVDDLTRVTRQPNAHVIIAFADERIVGSLIATFDGWRGNFYRLVVDPECRRQGIARDMVRDAEAWLRANGAKRLTALVEGDRPNAQTFWSAAGFEHYAGMRRYRKEL